MKINTSAIACCSLWLFFFNPGFAEVLEVPENPTKSSESAPKRGSPMDSVKSRYGEPQQVVNAVGVPPISRWVYDKFTVYFEKDHVIHTVAHP